MQNYKNNIVFTSQSDKAFLATDRERLQNLLQIMRQTIKDFNKSKHTYKPLTQDGTVHRTPSV